ncbi:MAG: hypothetical protein QOF76_899, partial [Solirubrobacteraceae bacterium]|nr:hypothetical protein [Solirubrobacteraceae bacterium]
VLEHRGLGAAIASLTAASPVAVTLDIADERFPEPVEVAVYFSVAEALANVFKHTAATIVAVRIARVGDRVVAEVSDDGAGGAVVAPGGGLAGLEDRIAALGGELSVLGGAGTVVRVELPL